MPATEVQGNEDAPMSRFTIKNEPDEEQLEVKREDEDIGLLNSYNPLPRTDNVNMMNQTDVKDKTMIQTENMDDNLCEATLNTHKCQYCNKAFTSQRYLQIHMRKHTGDKPFSCTVCGDQFSLRGPLMQHSKTHTDVTLSNHGKGKSATHKPFECQKCGKSFAVKSNLTWHNRVHTGQRLYRCKDCGKSFIQMSYLTQHRQEVHTREKPYECQDCGKSFTRIHSCAVTKTITMAYPQTPLLP